MEKTIFQLLENKKFGEIKEFFLDMNPADIAACFSEIEKPNDLVLFRILPKELASEVFVEMDTEMQKDLITAFSDKELKEVMNDIYMEDAVDIIDEMPANVAKRILAQASAGDRKLINQLLAYPEDSAGSIMTTEFVDLKASMTVADAFERIRKVGTDKETIYTCYIIDSSRHLKGIVSVKDLLLSKSDTLLEDIMNENIIFAATLQNQEEVVQLFDKYDLLALPVVDNENRLVGIITVDDAIDVLQEEITEDFEKMAAITPTDNDVPYLKTGVFEIFRSRIMWLLILMVSATFTGMIITSFESSLASLTVLTAFMPMLMNTGGNSGSQSSVTIIRALSLGEIEFRDVLRVLWKETRVSVLCGACLAVLNFFKMWVFDILLLKTEGLTLMVALVVSATLFFTVLIAKVVGCVLPIAAKKLGFDPAVMASPFITTIVDAISLTIYFFIAQAVLF